MCKDSEKETEREIEEQFDRFMRQTILDEGNKIRIEKGLPPLTEEDMGSMQISDESDDKQ